MSYLPDNCPMCGYLLGADYCDACDWKWISDDSHPAPQRVHRSEPLYTAPKQTMVDPDVCPMCKHTLGADYCDYCDWGHRTDSR